MTVGFVYSKKRHITTLNAKAHFPKVSFSYFCPIDPKEVQNCGPINDLMHSMLTQTNNTDAKFDIYCKLRSKLKSKQNSECHLEPGCSAALV